MKFLFDFLPIILFFGAFNYANHHKDWAAAFATEHFGALVSGGVVGATEAPVLLATLVVIVATLAQVGWLAARKQKIDLMLWISLGLVVVLGGATLWFHNKTFIMWKPSVLYWLMAGAFWLGPQLFGKNLLRAMLGEQMVLPEPVWQRLNWAWVAFFSVMGCLNLWVAYHFDTETWVNFKLFGAMGLMVVFTIVQGLYLSRYLQHDDNADAADSTADARGRSSR